MNYSQVVFTNYVWQELRLNVEIEHKFHTERKWRFDYAIPSHKIAIEVEGGVWTNGRHTRGKGFINDCEKYNEGTCLGWRILRVVPQNLIKQNTLDLIKKIIENE